MSPSTLAAAGSPRAVKRRKLDRSLSPESANLRRAKAADRSRKSQILIKLRNTGQYKEASADERAEMEEDTVKSLEEHRKATGQHATIKQPDAFDEEYGGTLGDFIEWDEHVEDSFDYEDERYLEKVYEDADSDGESGDEVDLSGSEPEDGEEESGDDNGDESQDGKDVERSEADRANEDEDDEEEEEVDESVWDEREAVALRDRKPRYLPNDGLRAILQKQYDLAARRYQRTQVEVDRERMEHHQKLLTKWDTERMPNAFEY